MTGSRVTAPTRNTVTATMIVWETTRSPKEAVPMASCTRAAGHWSMFVAMSMNTRAAIDVIETRRYRPSTVTGSTVYSGMRRRAPVTGHAGTAPPQNSTVLVVYSSTSRHTRATGPSLYRTARNTLCVKTTPTATYLWAARANATGVARAAILG